jgi:hypothetical protein
MMPPIMDPEIFTAIRPQGRAAFGHSCNCSCMRLGQRVAAWPQTIARVGIRFAETIQKNVAKIWFAPLQPNPSSSCATAGCIGTVRGSPFLVRSKNSVARGNRHAPIAAAAPLVCAHPGIGTAG